jgi:RNA polymerase sigma-70 factor (ECF subfamily)
MTQAKANNSKRPVLDPTDEALAAAMAKGDTLALETLMQRWSRPVYSLALRILREPGAAQEVSQDVFLKCWRNAATFQESRGHFSSWILTMTHHAAIDALRRQKARGKDVLQSFSEGLAATLSAPKSGVSPWQKMRIEGAMAQLNAAQRQVVDMAYFEGLTREEMALRLKTPVGTVKTRLRDALMKLNKIFSDPEQEMQSLPDLKA